MEDPQNNEHKRLVQLLARCKYLPGSWDKRFVKSLARGFVALTNSQVKQLHRIAWEKRKSLRALGFDPPFEWRMSDPKPISLEDQRKLDTWVKNAIANQPGISKGKPS